MHETSILIIEDDAAIRRGLADLLDHQGYRVLEAADGERGAEMASGCEYDLLLLDLILPETDGLEILRRVRADRPSVPVVILTARGSERQRVTGLKLGADDYVVKPFSPSELVARIEAVLRRSPQRPADVRELPVVGGTADLASRRIRYQDKTSCVLSEREALLLRYLAANPGRPVSRDELLRHVWQIPPAGVTTRTIDMHVARLREKLRDDPADPQIVRTIRGKGYMYAGEEVRR